MREAMARIEGAFSAVAARPRAGHRLPRPRRHPAAGAGRPRGQPRARLGDLRARHRRRDRWCASCCPARWRSSTRSGYRVEQAVPPRQHDSALCIFEFIYFARPDSRMDGQGLMAARYRMGERLACEAPADADIVISVPDSGTPAAQGYAHRSGLPFADGLVKNRYVGRTFIQPDQGLREHGLRLKFNPVPDLIARPARGGRRRLHRARLDDPQDRRRCCAPPAPPRCTCASRRRPSSRPATTASTWPAREELIAADRIARGDPPGARRRLARLPLAGRPAAVDGPRGRPLLPRLPDRRVPDGRARRGGDRQGALRALAPARPRLRAERAEPFTYAGAGVSLDAADAVVGRLAAAVASTRTPGVVPSHGGFAGLFQAPGRQDVLLVAGTDSVGTKILLHRDARHAARGRHRLRRDVRQRRALHGRAAALLPRLRRLRPARPRAHRASSSRASPTAAGGPAARCSAARRRRSRRSTAERDVDLAGFAVGAVERARLVDGTPRGASGDVLVGLASDGAHSNGFSLVRRLLEHHGLDVADAPAGLLAPTAIYAPEVAALLDAVDVRALAHVTGGGIEGNLPRVLPGRARRARRRRRLAVARRSSPGSPASASSATRCAACSTAASA